MLSSGKVKTSSWRYYTDAVACRATDYYLGIGEAPGRWTGGGLPELDLARGSRVTEQQLEALFGRALHPSTAERLGRPWRTNGVTGFDLTFSAPKSVSSLWALGNERVAAEVLEAHQAAVMAGLAYLEAHASFSRRGANGVEQIASTGLAAALFDHRTSREGDPQLHTHALVLNKVRCADGVWRSLDGREVFDHKKAAGMIYQTALRNEMTARVGVRFGPVTRDGQAELVGIPKELLVLWSKRTTAINAEAGPKINEYETLLGRSLTAAERARVTKTAVLKTRPGKTATELVTLRQSWADEAASIRWDARRLLSTAAVRLVRRTDRADERSPDAPHASGRLDTPADGTRTGTFEPVLNEGAGKAFDPDDNALAQQALSAAGGRSAVFSRTDVAGQVAAHLPSTGVTARETVARVEMLTERALALAEAIPVGGPARDLTPRASDDRFATLEVLQAEGRILSLAGRGSRRGYGAVAPLQLHEVLRHEALDTATADPSDVSPAPANSRVRGLDPGQLRAVQHLVGAGDFLTVMTAPAGAGKTSTLGVASRAWQAAGYRVVGLAPSARAAAELADATGGRSDTLAKWLHDHARLDRLPAAERTWTALDDRTVVIVDEASMASTLDLDLLCAVAGRAAAKIVLVGDPNQIGVINGPGGMLAALTHAGHGVTLEQIHRFSQPWERAASLQLRQGHLASLTEYGDQGRLHPCPDSDTALHGVFSHWSAARADGLEALMLARTRKDVDALNALARHAALTAGEITGPVTHSGGRDWQAGDVLRTRRNDRSLILNTNVVGPCSAHVRNGDRFQVLGPGPGPGPDNGLIVEALDGRGRIMLPAAYLEEHCEYGWASTIDSAQGATADIGLVLVRPGLDREHLYVAMTRGRHGNHAYITTDPVSDPADDHGHGPTTRRRAVGAEADAAAHRPGHPATGYRQDPLPFEQRIAVPAPAGVHPSTEATPELQEDTARVLRQALQVSGRQEAAHTALDAARRAARDLTATRDREQRERAEQKRATPLPVPDEHQKTLALIERLRCDQQAVQARQRELWHANRDSERELAAAPAWARGRRRELARDLESRRRELTELQSDLLRIGSTLDDATSRAERQAREQRAAEAARITSSGAAALAVRPLVDLAAPRPASAGPAGRAAARQGKSPALDPRRPAGWTTWEPSADLRSRDDRGLGR